MAGVLIQLAGGDAARPLIVGEREGGGPATGEHRRIFPGELVVDGVLVDAPLRLNHPKSSAVTASKDLVLARQSRKLAGDVGPCMGPARPDQTCTMRAGSRNGSGRISTVSTTLNIVLLTPMPSARQTTVSTENAGLPTSVRSA